MLIVMRQDASQKQIDEVISAVESKECKARPIPGGDRV